MTAKYSHLMIWYLHSIFSWGI